MDSDRCTGVCTIRGVDASRNQRTAMILISRMEVLDSLLTALISVSPKFIVHHLRKVREKCSRLVPVGMLKRTCWRLGRYVRTISCIMVGNEEGWGEAGVT